MEWELPDGQVFVGEPIAYIDKADCTDPRCLRMIGAAESGCLGYHCPRCGEPCGSQGHSRCPNKDAAEESAPEVEQLGLRKLPDDPFDPTSWYRLGNERAKRRAELGLEDKITEIKVESAES